LPANWSWKVTVQTAACAVLSLRAWMLLANTDPVLSERVEPVKAVTVEKSWELEMYPPVARPANVLVIFAATRGIAPFMLDTIICGVQTAPDAVKRPVLIWREEWDVVMMSPMLMKPVLDPIASESTTRELMKPCVPVTNAAFSDDVKMRLAERVFVDPLNVMPATVEKSWVAEIYVAVPRPAVVLASFTSKPTVEMNPWVPRLVILLASSTGSIIDDTYVLTPSTVEFRIAVRPIDDVKPIVPRPTTVEASSTGSIMLEMLLVRPSMDERNWPVDT
jgi:hypothetical protein